MTREEMKQQSREALVDAALELFAEQGIDGPSLDAICERAGYTRGVFYVHFEDREELLVAAMTRIGEAYLDSVFKGLAGGGPPRRGRRVNSAAERFGASVRRGDYPLMRADAKNAAPLVRMHQLLDACARSLLVRARYRDLVLASMQVASGLVEEDQRDGGVRRDVEPSAIGALALAMIIGAQTMSELGISLDPALLAKTVERLLA